MGTTSSAVIVQLSITPTSRSTHDPTMSTSVTMSSQRRRTTDDQTGRSPAGIAPLGVVPTLIPAPPTSTGVSWDNEGKKFAIVGPPRKMPAAAAAPTELMPMTTMTNMTDNPLKNWNTSGAALPSASPYNPPPTPAMA